MIETFATAFVKARVENVLPTCTKSKTVARHFRAELPTPTLTKELLLTMPLSDNEDPKVNWSKLDNLLIAPDERILSALFKL
jgi:hypothetical protein